MKSSQTSTPKILKSRTSRFTYRIDDDIQIDGVQKVRHPTVRMSDGTNFRVDYAGLICSGRLSGNRRLSPPKEFEILIAMRFLETAIEAHAIIKTPNCSTYRTKHCFQLRYGYVTNGAMILACGRLGVPMTYKNDLNPRIGILKKWLEDQEKLDRDAVGLWAQYPDGVLSLPTQCRWMLNTITHRFGVSTLDERALKRLERKRKMMIYRSKGIAGDDRTAKLNELQNAIDTITQLIDDHKTISQTSQSIGESISWPK